MPFPTPGVGRGVHEKKNKSDEIESTED